MAESTHVLCRNETTGGEALLPAEAVQMWASRGWQPVPEEELAVRAADEAASQPRVEAAAVERVAAEQASNEDEETELPSGGEGANTEGAAAVGPDMERE